ncbi:MAG TPA: S49 family peptidase [Paracoccaceae bacterium]|nr:S49 family peptidase [Paracoccaceae bacterium]
MRTDPAKRPRGGILGRLRELVRPRRPVVAVVPMNGAIMAGGRIGRAFDDEQLAPVIERAFRARDVKAVALAINCPGGSAVQSSMIADRIRRLSAERQVPVVAFCADVAASGGYWLACAADEIYADAGSIVGSIGVIAASFGFHDAISKLGVERRVHTSGEQKSFWDPFRPEREEDVERLLRLQHAIHRQFVAWVTLRRGNRLSDGRELFNGEFWDGEEAHRLGLVDGIGHLAPVMKARFGDKTRFRIFTRKRPLFSRFGLAGADTLADELQTRGLFARFGL